MFIISTLYLYFWEPSSINIGMENPIAPAGSVFKSLFRQHLPTHIIQRIFERNGPARRRPPVLTPAQLIMSLTFHVVAGAGTLSQHVQQLMHLSLSDSALAQRRALIFSNRCWLRCCDPRPIRDVIPTRSTRGCVCAALMAAFTRCPTRRRSKRR